MFRRIWGVLCGYVVLHIAKEARGAVYDIIFRLGMDFFGEKNRKGELILCLPREYEKTFCACLSECGVEGVTISDLRGFPVAIRFLRRRLGILLGILMFFLWSFVSQRIVWDIRIEGNTVTPDDEIIGLLSELGCGYGAWIPSIDYDDVHAKYLAASENIGWISVFMNGTVAEVQVRELVRKPRTEHEDGVYANVVASEGGEIEIVRVAEGQAAVKKGDVVKAGDLVISGIVEKKDQYLPEGGFRYEYAAGEVIARTARSIEVEIDLQREEKVYTGEETVRKSIKIFGNLVKLFQNSGIVYTKYDKIDKIERVSLFGLWDLPLWMEETVFREYRYEMREISPEQAAAEAFAELRYLTDEAVGNGELLRRTVSSSLEDGKYIIRCLLYVERDIGETKEFSVTE